MQRSIVALLTASCWAQEAPAPGSKVAFESPNTVREKSDPGQPVPGGSAYVVRALPNGKIERLPLTHVFGPGESVELRVRPGVDGLLAAYAKEGDKLIQLFPQKRLYNNEPRVRKGEELTIPMQFDHTPGVTTLRLVIVQTDHEQYQKLLKALPEKDVKELQELEKRITSEEKSKGGKSIVVPDDKDQPETGSFRVSRDLSWKSLTLRNR
jgi:hypothetical protein